jgi:peroxiredoxin (alkyl hydroperoxide reductase subunit C)
LEVVANRKKRWRYKGVKFPLVADSSMTISENYDVLAGDYDYNEDGQLVFNGTPMAYRGLFLIDKDGVVRHRWLMICHSAAVLKKLCVW